MKQQNERRRTDKTFTLVSLGRHTRLCDVLEYALEGISFETIEPEELQPSAWTGGRLLFAASADAQGENSQIRRFTARLNSGAVDLSGCTCALIADCEQGGAIHLDALGLLLKANAAGAAVIPRPLLEAGRDLRALAGGGKETPFARYCAFARDLANRLVKSEYAPARPRQIRLLTALDDGTAGDWRGALKRIASASGGALTEETNAGEAVLLCENNGGLPDEKTLSLLVGGGWGRFLIASPTGGSDLYTAALFERACVRGGYGLPPWAVTVFEGMSAAEALSDMREMEKITQLFSE